MSFRYLSRTYSISASRLAWGAVVLLIIIGTGWLQAGDILRGGAGNPAAKRSATATSNAGSEGAAQASANAKDRLARTTQAIQAVRKMQQSAGSAAVSVPDGLQQGGLKVLTGPNARWDGANAPVQSGNLVTIKQNDAQALLHWETFNVGRNTTVNFDQSAGKADAGKWVAFNKIYDPSGKPSQILGSIKADGQVYVINQNGIVFGAGSQVNMRSFVASSLPINDNLVKNGLLNNPNAQFLFSALTVPGSSDGTPAFIPEPPLTPSGLVGDVLVERGATIKTSVSSDGSGGRVMLVGANVANEGTISTPAGQTIIAAGLQVGIQPHAQIDPSLRGLDVWVGDVGSYAGKATNSGLIQSVTGSIMMVGKTVNQLGILDSSTTVDLNGRIDLLASYGAVGNPGFGSASEVNVAFLSQYTGTVEFGPSSVTRVLPDYTSTKTIPGTRLPEKSQINAEGLIIHLGTDAIIQATSGDVRLRAGVWPYKDIDGNRTTFVGDTSNLDFGVNSYISARSETTPEFQRFLLSGGQVFLDSGSLIDVSGSTDVFVAMSQNIATIQLRGPELADSPLQRAGILRGQDLTVDLRVSGTLDDGRYWVGTPLGDLTAVAAVIQRNVAQLTAQGGTVGLLAGDSVVVQRGAVVDVSGGYFRNEGGTAFTTKLLRNGMLIDIADATPDQVYSGVYNGQHIEVAAKWGVTKTYKHALAPKGLSSASEYLQGASAGSVNFQAPTLVSNGELLGRAIDGARQLDTPTKKGSLTMSFTGQALDSTGLQFLPTAPYPVAVTFVNKPVQYDVAAFDASIGVPSAISNDLRQNATVASALYTDGGFGYVTVETFNGNVVVPSATNITTAPGGSLTVKARNITVDGSITALGGRISLTAYNLSPTDIAQYTVAQAVPVALAGQGVISIGSGASLSTAGLIVDDRDISETALTQPRIVDGGTIALNAFSANLASGSLLNVSGGVWAKPKSGYSYGDGGSISVMAGINPLKPTLIGDLTVPDLAGIDGKLTGGVLTLEGVLQGYSAAAGGSLALQADRFQIGGPSSSSAVLLQPEFFQSGGFAKYTVAGIGTLDRATGLFPPAVLFAEGVQLAPRADSLVLSPYRGSQGLRFDVETAPVGQRAPTSVEFLAIGTTVDDSFTTGILEGRGDIVMQQGTAIRVDPGASVTLSGDTVSVLGAIDAPGGTIKIAGKNAFPLAPDVRTQAQYATPTVYIGAQARLTAQGATVYIPDSFGRRVGTAYDGGTISVAGNIVAAAGAVLDVSGTSAMFDIHPSLLGATGSVSVTSGLTSSPWAWDSMPYRIDTNGGVISLLGGQMLLSDATLQGFAGGPTAMGGTLSISSGRFYEETANRASSDINLVVTQSGNVIAATNSATGVNVPIRDANGNILTGMGYFAMDRFAKGGFDSLDLGFEFYRDSTLGSVGGNIEFRGPVAINAHSLVRLARGGVIQANAPVSVDARYVAVGQDFILPTNSKDTAVFPFRHIVSNQAVEYNFAPTSGSGQLSLSGSLIDVGTLSLQTIGSAQIIADNGDIRGNGTLNIRGDLYLRAAQIYPTTASTFNIFAYDPVGGTGSVTIASSGRRPTPLSAGGALNIFASTIAQGGVLVAPFGAITLGWDGTDFDRSTAAFDSPLDPISRTAITVPIAQNVTLSSGSVTSVAGVDWQTGQEMLIPYGLSPDGLKWIDPRGEDVTTAGLPQKKVLIAGQNVTTEGGSLVDIRGGGDLLAYRWVAGNGGSTDLLGTASAAWTSGSHNAGELVTYNGKTWSARVSLDPSDFDGGETPAPKAGPYWREVAESYAIVPGFGSEFAPIASYNAGQTGSSNLGKDPGYVSSSLSVGDVVSLDLGNGQSGLYTLLPRRYAELPGALLITPQSGGPSVAAYAKEDGSAYLTGYTINAFSSPTLLSGIRSLYEVASPAVVASRVDNVKYGANTFLPEAADRLQVALQRLPQDGGYLGIQGTAGFNLAGSVLASRTAWGLGSSVDLSSNADIVILGAGQSAPVGATAIIDSSLVSSWGMESLLIGGLRYQVAGVTSVDVRTNGLTVDNAGSELSAPEIILASRSRLTLSQGSAVTSSGGLSQPAEVLNLPGDGTLIRVSGDTGASIVRSSLAGATSPLLTIGDGVRLAGGSVILDSTYATDLSPLAFLDTQALTLGSGQISIVLSGSSSTLAGSVLNPHLVLEGDVLQRVQQVSSLTLRSYRTIDIYGSGTFGSDSLTDLTLSGAGIRGFEQNGGSAVFVADNILLSNPNVAAALTNPATSSGELRFETETTTIGANTFSVAGYQNLVISAQQGVLGVGKGGLATQGHLTIRTPLITGERGSEHTFTATGAMELLSSGGTAEVSTGLGATLNFAASSILANTDIILPSGLITMRATGANGDIQIGGRLSTEGSAQYFQDLVRYAGAGSISLTAAQGNVNIGTGGSLSVAAAQGGGSAGTILVSAENGQFNNDGTLYGQAIADADSGTFLLDVGSLPSYADLNDPLQVGGFFKERNIRVRSGDVDMVGTSRARAFSLSADAGSIRVAGTIDASGLNEVRGLTGGTISLAANGSVTLLSGSVLTVHAKNFSSAGKGGAINIESGNQRNGVVPTGTALDLQSGSLIDLAVDAYVAGAMTDVGSSAFNGQFTGTLHLRAPQIAVGGNIGVEINPLNGQITGASSIVVEGYKLYDLASTNGQITGTRTNYNGTPSATLAAGTVERQVYDNGVAFIGQAGQTTAGYTAMMTSLLGADPQQLASLLVLAPGAEIINSNPNGDLTLGNATSNWALDWNLADFRFGAKSAAGVLTLRAPGNIVFWNSLSDGFTAVNPATAGNGNSSLWLGQVMAQNPNLPLNAQSWSYRIVAGADLSAADVLQVKPLDTLADGKGSVRVGKTVFIPSSSTTTASVIGNASTSNFQVIRTGTGNIDIAAARDVKLLNPFASIYTAGARIVNDTSIYSANDFVRPLVEQTTLTHPSQNSQLGNPQQIYRPQWTMAGGNVNLAAGGDIGRYSVVGGVDVVDSSKQMPNNWLYRRGYVGTDGTFGVGGVNGTGAQTVTDASASTTWWVDFSNFFEGVGALGGGDVSVRAGRDILNIDAVIPTNARMAGRIDNGDGTFTNIAPDASKLLELGGGDLEVVAGRDISGGVYYVERGTGVIDAGGSITTNSTRATSQNGDSLTWLPTTLLVGKSSFSVQARGDVLLGPIANPFLLPQGVNNKFWYKTYFNTYGEGASVDVVSLGGDIRLRFSTMESARVSAESADQPIPILRAWLSYQNLLGSTTGAAQPWVRLAETSVNVFDTAASLLPPTLRSTAFAGNINIAGSASLFPSPTGTLEFAAADGVIGLQPIGQNADKSITAWTSARINVSDADPNAIPGILSPFAYQSVVGRVLINQRLTGLDGAPPLFSSKLDQYFKETGSYTGENSSFQKKNALHKVSLHAADESPVRVYSGTGDITGFTLYTPKQTRVIAGRDVTDVAFYFQNNGTEDVSLVSAARDVIPNNQNSAVRSLANDRSQGNVILDTLETQSDGSQTLTLPGDIQIAGPGALEVLAGRNVDLGTGANLADGRGTGITSIGNNRNTSLPFEGARLVVLAGVHGVDGESAATGLLGSSLNFEDFLTASGVPLTESEAILALDGFFDTLRQGAEEFTTTGSYSSAFAAIESLFGSAEYSGELLTRARDIRTTNGGAISLFAPGGSLTMASDIIGAPKTPPGIVTEYGGPISIFTNGNVEIGKTRIFTLRGGDLTIWSSFGDIAAGTAAKTVVTAPPTRVLVDTTSASIKTDLGGLATGGGIGVLASVADVEPASVFLIAPNGTVDAGDAGIRATGNITIAAVTVLNADNIAAAGTTTGVSASAPPAAPNVAGLTSGSNATAAASSAADQVANQSRQRPDQSDIASVYSVEVLGYGGGSDDSGSRDEEDERRKSQDQSQADDQNGAVPL